jgi:hypothetical protein
MSPMMKVAAAFVAAAVLIGTGWAGEKIYKKLTQVSVTLERFPQRTWTLPGFGSMISGGSLSETVDSGDPQALEAVKRRHEEMKKLIAEKKYELVKSYVSKFDGLKNYVYKFTFADGSTKNQDLEVPLESVDSWEVYLRKVEERHDQERQAISKAVVAGKFRLLDVDQIIVHICRDVGGDQKFKVQHIPLPDGNDIALIRPFDLEAENQATTMPQTSWQEHLQAVREGKREILSLDSCPNYTYEAVLEDGFKAVFSYAGGDPLKKP